MPVCFVKHRECWFFVNELNTFQSPILSRIILLSRKKNWDTTNERRNSYLIVLNYNWCLEIFQNESNSSFYVWLDKKYEHIKRGNEWILNSTRIEYALIDKVVVFGIITLIYIIKIVLFHFISIEGKQSCIPIIYFNC